MSADDTLPPSRRAADERLSAFERALKENTDLTAENTVRLNTLSGTVDEIKTGTDSLLEMKTMFENHLTVLCTWGRWGRRALYGLCGLLGVVLPVVVAAKQLGWL